MTSTNVARVHQYLQAVAAMGAPETVADFFASDVVFQEFPNRIAPQGRVRRFADLGAAYGQGRKILQSQAYNVRRIVEAGDEVAVELEWHGILAVPVMNLPAGSEMKRSWRCFSRSATERLFRSKIMTAIYRSARNLAPRN
jgi:hypothetical protein